MNGHGEKAASMLVDLLQRLVELASDKEKTSAETIEGSRVDGLWIGHARSNPIFVTNQGACYQILYQHQMRTDDLGEHPVYALQKVPLVMVSSYGPSLSIDEVTVALLLWCSHYSRQYGESAEVENIIKNAMAIPTD